MKVHLSFVKNSKLQGIWLGNFLKEDENLCNLSLPKEMSTVNLRHLGGKIMRNAKKLDWQDFCVRSEQKIDSKYLKDIIFGIYLYGWEFDHFKKKDQITCEIDSDELDFNKNEADAILFARELICTPSNLKSPKMIIEKIQQHLPKNLEVSILDKKEMEKLGMNLILGVAQGSYNEPYLIVIKKGSPKVAIVGKGVTFDTGGISLKPAKKMGEMISDMSGAAAVVSTAMILAESTLDFYAIAGFVENMPGGKAQRPGDILIGMSKKSVLVDNTDAEGRLLLGDLVYYASDKLGCEEVIDIATLTGASEVALGREYACLCTNCDDLSKKIIECGEITGEKVWRLPCGKEYDYITDCAHAHMHNVGNGTAGVIAGAKFIEKNLKEGTRWAHLDIAAVSRNERNPISSEPFCAFGILLLVEYLKRFEKDL